MLKKSIVGIVALVFVIWGAAFAKAHLEADTTDASEQPSRHEQHRVPEVKEASIGDVQVFLQIEGLAGGKHEHGEHGECKHMKSEGKTEPATCCAGSSQKTKDHECVHGEQAMTPVPPRIMVALLHKGTHPLRNTSVRARVASDAGEEAVKLKYDPKEQFYSAPLTLPHTGACTVRVLFTREAKDHYVDFDYGQILNDT